MDEVSTVKRVAMGPSKSAVVAALTGAMLLAGVSVDAAAAGSHGQIRLQMGPGAPYNRFVYEAPDGSLGADQRLYIERGTKCIVDSGASGLAGTGLVRLAAIGPDDATTPRLGMGTDSLGVYDNSKGVSCYRMTGSIGEGMSFGLGTGAVSASKGGNLFDRLELDMEVKGNAWFHLTVKRAGSVTEIYELRSGGSVNLLEGDTGESSPGDAIFNCSATSDSGPDSGASDNCRWIINDLGDSFVLTASVGEGSLEGGGDFAQSFTNNTIIYLTSLSDSGELGCTNENNKTAQVGGGATAACQVTRINPTGIGGSCDALNPIPYTLASDPGKAACELTKTGGVADVQLAGSMEIAFPPEPRVDGSGASYEYPKTTISFSPGNETLQPSLCTGTLVDDVNGNPTILEVLTDPNFAPDVDTSTAVKDWACVLDNRQVYLGKDGAGVEQMQIVQTILFWGDIRFSRD